MGLCRTQLPFQIPAVETTGKDMIVPMGLGKINAVGMTDL